MNNHFQSQNTVFYSHSFTWATADESRLRMQRCALLALAAICLSCESQAPAVDVPPRLEVVAGRAEGLAVNVNGGEIQSVAWNVSSAVPEACRGSVEPKDALGAAYRAPSAELCPDGGTNTLELSIEFANGHHTRNVIVVAVQAAEKAAEVSVKEPMLPPKDTTLPTIASQFEGETYFDFSDAGFVARHDFAMGALGVHLSAPKRSGFGGVCVVRASGVFDASAYRRVHVELEMLPETKGRLDVKLEGPDSLDPEFGQRILGHVDIPSEPRKGRFSFEIDAPRELVKSVKRVCFATTAEKLSGAPFSLGARVRALQFE